MPKLHKEGYAVFVLRYSIWLDLSDMPRCRIWAMQCGTSRIMRRSLMCSRKNMPLWAIRPAGIWRACSARKKPTGYNAWHVPKPGALILAYAINDFSEIKPVYHVIMDPGAWDWRYYWSSIAEGVTENYPPVYFWYGENDRVLPLMNPCAQGPTLKKALDTYGVPYEMHVYRNAGHAIGTGQHTDADGWLKEAAAFWVRQTAE